MTTQASLIWLEVLRALAPLVAAGLAAYVAHKFGTIQVSILRQQAETAAAAAATARNKLKLDLFDRRWAIYKAASDAISSSLGNGNISSDDLMTYSIGTQGAQWLFGKDVTNCLDGKLWHLLYDFHATNAELRESTTPDSRQQLAEKRNKLFKEVNDQRRSLDSLFEPYLKLET